MTDEAATFVAEQWLAGYATADVAKMVSFSSMPFTVGGEVAAETAAALTEQYKQLIGEAGALRDRSLLTAAEYRAKTGAEATLPDGALVLLVRTTSESFALVLVRVAAEFPKLGHVTALAGKDRGASGRIGTLTITGKGGTIDVTGDLRIRRLLGGLKSTLFRITAEGGKAPTSATTCARSRSSGGSPPACPSLPSRTCRTRSRSTACCSAATARCSVFGSSASR